MEQTKPFTLLDGYAQFEAIRFSGCSFDAWGGCFPGTLSAFLSACVRVVISPNFVLDLRMCRMVESGSASYIPEGLTYVTTGAAHLKQLTIVIDFCELDQKDLQVLFSWPMRVLRVLKAVSIRGTPAAKEFECVDLLPLMLERKKQEENGNE